LAAVEAKYATGNVFSKKNKNGFLLLIDKPLIFNLLALGASKQQAESDAANFKIKLLGKSTTHI
jgi:hypothetical protein